MKKVFLVLALVATYGVSIAMSGSNAVTAANSQTTIVADMGDNNVVAPEAEKEKEKAKDAKASKSEAKSEGCATAKSEGCGEKAKAECADKKEGSKK